MPAILAGTPPAAIVGRGMPVEPTHVLDLGLLLPASILAGILVLRRRPWGYALSGVVLCLLVPLLVAVNAAPLFQVAAGQPIAPGPVVSYLVIGIVNVLLTWRFLAHARGAAASATPSAAAA